jgi:hypothetical protein
MSSNHNFYPFLVSHVLSYVLPFHCSPDYRVPALYACFVYIHVSNPINKKMKAQRRHGGQYGDEVGPKEQFRSRSHSICKKY